MAVPSPERPGEGCFCARSYRTAGDFPARQGADRGPNVRGEAAGWRGGVMAIWFFVEIAILLVDPNFGVASIRAISGAQCDAKGRCIRTSKPLRCSATQNRLPAAHTELFSDAHVRYRDHPGQTLVNRPPTTPPSPPHPTPNPNPKKKTRLPAIGPLHLYCCCVRFFNAPFVRFSRVLLGPSPWPSICHLPIQVVAIL